MNVIETIQQLLTDCDLMNEFNGVHIDYTEAINGDFGMFPVGPNKTGEDIIGNSKYRITFQLYAGLFAFEDYERLNNTGFLTKLTYWLNKQKNIDVTETVDDVEHKGLIKSIEAGNALLYEYPTGDINDGVRYQIQLQVDYIVYEF